MATKEASSLSFLLLYAILPPDPFLRPLGPAISIVVLLFFSLMTIYPFRFLPPGRARSDLSPPLFFFLSFFL